MLEATKVGEILYLVVGDIEDAEADVVV